MAAVVMTRRPAVAAPLTDEQLAEYEKQAAEVLREVVENPHTLPTGDAAVESGLAAIVQRLVTEVRRLRAASVSNRSKA